MSMNNRREGGSEERSGDRVGTERPLLLEHAVDLHRHRTDTLLLERGVDARHEVADGGLLDAEGRSARPRGVGRLRARDEDAAARRQLHVVDQDAGFSG